MATLFDLPTSAAAKAGYARATLHTAAVIADPSATLMDRLHAAEAEQAACEAYWQAEPELEAGA
jgi:hypothetical protein